MEALSLCHLVKDDMELLISINVDATPELGVLQVPL